MGVQRAGHVSERRGREEDEQLAYALDERAQVVFGDIGGRQADAFGDLSDNLARFGRNTAPIPAGPVGSPACGELLRRSVGSPSLRAPNLLSRLLCQIASTSRTRQMTGKVGQA
jgi:hypothetical protein